MIFWKIISLSLTASIVLSLFSNTFLFPLIVSAAEEINTVTEAAREIPAVSVSDAISDNPALQKKAEVPEVPILELDKGETKTPETESMAEKTDSKPLAASDVTPSSSMENSGDVVPKPKMPEVSAVTGALNYEYQFKLPAGRLSMEPDIKLVYKSDENNNINIAGYGWDLNTLSIDRINRKGISTLYTEDFFYSPLSGELVKTTDAGKYVALVDNGNFILYQYNAASSIWKAYDKKGNVYTFGNTASSHYASPADANKVAKWFINEICDANGNYISYNYTQEANDQIFLSEITYTNHQSDTGVITNGIYKVSFIYETRLDVASSRKWGFDTKNTKRLKTVEVRTSGNLSKKYELAYSAGVNTIRSLLASVTETGYDQNRTAITLPPTFFDYTKGKENKEVAGGISMWETEMRNMNYYEYSDQINQVMSDLSPSGTYYADLNGDGYLDVFTGFISLGNGSYQQTVTANSLGDPFSTDCREKNIIPPVVVSYFKSQNGGVYRSVLDTSGAAIFDSNGDGLVDFYSKEYSSYGYSNPAAFYLNNSDNASNVLSFTNMPEMVGNYSVGSDTIAGDFEGTGIQSLISAGKRQGAIDLNGDGIDEMVSLDVDRFGNDIGVRYIDMNADGLVDRVRGWTLSANGTTRPPVNENHDVDIFTGDQYLRVATSSLGSPEFIVYWPETRNYIMYGRLHNYVDTNGDGINQASTMTTRADLLKKIEYPMGGNTAVTYKTSTHYRDASGNLLNPKLPLILWTVAEIKTEDGLGGTPMVEKYTYENGRMFYRGPYNRKFAGFEKVTKNNGVATEINYYHQGNNNNASTGETGDAPNKIGYAYKTEIFDSSNQLLSRTQNIYVESPREGAIAPFGVASSSPALVYISTQLTEIYNPTTGSHKDHVQTFSYDNQNGNLTQISDFGETRTNSSVSKASNLFIDLSDDTVTTRLSYAMNDVSYGSFGVIYKISSETVFDNYNEKIKENHYFYDNQQIPNLTKGNETKKENLISGKAPAFFARSSKQYNQFGLVTAETNENNNTTNYTYDQYYLYPQSVQNPLGQTNNFQYNYLIGAPTIITDANLFVQEKVYDGFGRVVEEKISDPDDATGSQRVTVLQREYLDAVRAISIKEQRYFDANKVSDSYSYFDGLGRLIQARKKVPDTTACVTCYSAQDKIYDAQGKTQKESLPYFVSGNQKSAATTIENLWIKYDYDAVGRVAKITNVLGIERNDYSVPRIITSYDRLNHRKDYESDIFGRLIKVNEHISGTVASTYYIYDQAGNLTKIFDAQENERNFVYDNAGRRLMAEDLHSYGDIMFGVWNYTYDPGGNLHSKKNPNGVTVIYDYDKLERVKSEDAQDKAGVEVSYTYDNCQNGKGRLCSVVSPVVMKNCGYDGLGRAVNEKKVIRGKTFVSKTDYDRQGNVLSVENPDGSSYLYSYDSAGYLERVSKKEINEAAYSPVITTSSYSPNGQPTNIYYWNGVNTTKTYDVDKMYRLIRTQTIVVPSGRPNNGDSGGPSKSMPAPAPKTSLMSNLVSLLVSAIIPETAWAATAPNFTINAVGGRAVSVSSVAIPPSALTPCTGCAVPGRYYLSIDFSFTSFFSNAKRIVFTNENKVEVGVADILQRSYKLNIPALAYGKSTTITATISDNKNKPLLPLISKSVTVSLAAPTITMYSIGGIMVLGPTLNISYASFGSCEYCDSKTTHVLPVKFSYTNLSSSATRVMFTNEKNAQLGIAGINQGGGYNLYIPVLAPGKSTTIKATVVDNFNKPVSPLTTNSIIAILDVPTFTIKSVAGVAVSGASVTIPITAVSPCTNCGAGNRYNLPVNVSYSSLPKNSQRIVFKNENNIEVGITSVQQNSYNLYIPELIPGKSTVITATVTDNFNQPVSPSVTKSVTVNAAALKVVATPVITPVPGTYQTEQTVGITSTTTGATIYYTLDGMAPSATSTPYAAPFILKNTATVKAVAVKAGMSSSAVALVAYTIFPPKVPISFGNIIQDLSYNYDALGNITQVVDASDTNTKKITNYTYDDLSRLISTTITNSRDDKNNYTESYGYNTLGNILTKSFSIGTSTPKTINYLYEGNSGASFANPHTPTAIGTTTIAYDSAGNMTQESSTLYMWDYNNRLIRAKTAKSDNVYEYDEAGARVITHVTVASSTLSTYYPTREYNEDSKGTVTKHLFAQGGMVGTIMGTASTSQMYYNHSDYLSGQGVTTDALGKVVEVVDYYPFGEIRLDDKSSDFSEQRKYIGEMFDDSTGLNYLNARYYASSRGQFLSQDPVFWEFSREILLDPQQANSYSYARNNPISNKDPSGRCVWDACVAEGAFAVEIATVAWGVAATAVTALSLNQYLIRNNEKYRYVPFNTRRIVTEESARKKFPPINPKDPKFKLVIGYGLMVAVGEYAAYQRDKKEKEESLASFNDTIAKKQAGYGTEYIYPQNKPQTISSAPTASISAPRPSVTISAAPYQSIRNQLIGIRDNLIKLLDEAKATKKK